MPNSWQHNQVITAQQFNNPQPGDTFTEMLTFYVIVLERNGDMVTWTEAHPPCELPRDGKILAGTVRQFSQSYEYGTIPGWSVYATKSTDVTGWLDYMRQDA